MDEKIGLYIVNRASFSSTVVAALSEQHALSIAARIDERAFRDAKHTYGVETIGSKDDLPQEWHEERPWCDPKVEGTFRDWTCEEYFSDAALESEDERMTLQHAIDQQLHGAAILRAPRNGQEIATYVRFSVQCTSQGIYFTSLRPIPQEIRPFFVCYALKPDTSGG